MLKNKIILKSGNKQAILSKDKLCLESEFFSTMFACDMKEATQSTIDLSKLLHEQELTVFEKAITCFDLLKTQDFRYIYQVADKLLCHRLKKQVGKRLARIFLRPFINALHKKDFSLLGEIVDFYPDIVNINFSNRGEKSHGFERPIVIAMQAIPTFCHKYDPDPELVCFLVQHDAELNFLTRHREPPMMLIRQLNINNLNVIKMLLDAGADPNLKAKTGKCIVEHLSALSGDFLPDSEYALLEDILLLLFQHGYNGQFDQVSESLIARRGWKTGSPSMQRLQQAWLNAKSIYDAACLAENYNTPKKSSPGRMHTFFAAPPCTPDQNVVTSEGRHLLSPHK